MALITWDDSMKVGIPSVDHEHETLINDINAIGDVIGGDMIHRTEIAALLGKVHAQIEAHFALEEKIMLDKGYNGYHAHKEDHDRLLEDIRDIMDDAATADTKDTANTLGARLDTWFSEHFRTLDRSFHSFLNG